jgi:hypothetical protein
MSFSTLEQAERELARQNIRLEAERPSALQELYSQRQKLFMEQLRKDTSSLRGVQEKFQKALEAQKIEEKRRALETNPVEVFLAKATPSERQEFYKNLGIQRIDTIVGSKGTILQRIKTEKGEVASLDPYARARKEYEKRLKELQKKQKEELAKMTIQEKLVYKYIPEQAELFTKQIKGPESWFKKWVLESPVNILATTTQAAVALTQPGLLKTGVADPMAKYYIEELPSTPEGRKELYIQAIITAVLGAINLGIKKYTTGSFFGKVGTKTKETPKIKDTYKVEVIKPKTTRTRPYFQEIYPKVIKDLTKKNIEIIAKSEAKARGIEWSKLSSTDKNFIVGQIEARLRTQPELFIPKARRIALEAIKKQTEQAKLISKARQQALQLFEKPKKISETRYTSISKGKGFEIFVETSKLKKEASLLKIKKQAQPRQVIPKARQQALQLLEKPKVKQKPLKIIKLTEKPLVTKQQLKTLQRYGFKAEAKAKTKQLKLFEPLQILAVKYKKPPKRLKTITTAEQIVPEVKTKVSTDFVPLLLSYKVEGKEEVTPEESYKIKVKEETGALLPTVDVEDIMGYKEIGKISEKTLQAGTISYVPLFEEKVMEQAQFEKQFEKIRQKERIKQKEKIKQLEKLKPKIKKVPFKIELPKSTTLKKALKKIKKTQAFELFIKTKGKYKKVGEFGKAKAISLGTKIMIETLAATFKIKPLKKLIEEKPLRLRLPSIEEFRTYKIRKGKKIPLEFEWIQRRGKRLSSRKEVSEIQRARNNANFFGTSRSRLKWF